LRVDRSGDLHSEADPFCVLVFRLGELVSFSVLVGLSVYYRKRPNDYKHLMLLATVGYLTAAPLGRGLVGLKRFSNSTAKCPLPLDLLYSSSAVYDLLTRQRIHTVPLLRLDRVVRQGELQGGRDLPERTVARVRGRLVGQ
jgi:hypothetical protein